MPTFRPPLGCTSTATFAAQSPDIAETERQPYLQLNFIAELAASEHVDGTYELWTDIADLNIDGEPRCPAAQWHAIPYVQKEEAGDRYLVAQPTIPANKANFAYTLRLVKGNGEVVWLGSGGDNGVVQVKQQEVSTIREKEAVKSAWQGMIDDGEGVQWKGIAATMQSTSPRTQSSLPTSFNVTAQLIVARSAPFCLPATSVHPTAEPTFTDHTEYVVIQAPSESLQVGPGLVLPNSDPLASFCRYHNLHDAIATVRSASPAPGGVHVITEKDVLEGKLVHSSDAAKRSLLVHDSAAPNTIHLPKIESTGSILLDVEGVVQAYDAVFAASIKIDAGLSATAIIAAPLIEVRSAGKDDAIWIGTISGRVMDIGEEEVEDDQKPIVHVPASPAQQACAISKYGSTGLLDGIDGTISAKDCKEEGAETDGPSESYRTAQQYINVDTSSGENEDEEDDNKSTANPASSSFAHLLSRLVTRLFAWLFWPFGFGKTIAPPKTEEDDRLVRERESTPEQHEQDGTSSSVREQATERTPLLSTPGLSRSTSASLFSPLASPESIVTIKPAKLYGADVSDKLSKAAQISDTHQDLLSFGNGAASGSNSPGPSTALGLSGTSGTSTPKQVYDTTMSAPHATVKSYVRFAFDTAMPAALWAYRPMASGEIKDVELAFSVKKAGETTWADVKATMETCEGQQGLLKVLLTLEGETEEGLQVQVTRA